MSAEASGKSTGSGRDTNLAAIKRDERILWLAGLAASELERALDKFETFNSPHEGLAVIWEEFEELKAHVWENTARYSDAMDEAVQVAAMALRFVHDLAEWGPGYAGQ